MRLRRYEFGIVEAGGGKVEVYARRGDGARFTKTFDTCPDIIERAEQDFRVASHTWHKTPGHADSPGLSKVWNGRGALYISGEAAITEEALAAAKIDTIVSVSRIKDATRAEILAYTSSRPETRHFETPMLDVLARHQDNGSSENARRALQVVAASLADGRSVLVHCLMGIHRSVAVAAVSLTLCGAFSTPREAFLHIQERRHIAGRNTESFEWLEQLAVPRPEPR